jgi:hypothetical protein
MFYAEEGDAALDKIIFLLGNNWTLIENATFYIPFCSCAFTP